MDEEEPKEQRLDKRTIIIVVATIILSFIAFYLVDNYQVLIAGTAKGDEWDRIDTRIVEQNCLSQAQQVAVSEGYDPHVVLSCSCINVQSEILKTFDCDINTVDLTHPSRKVMVHCYKTSSQCTIAYDRGIETIHFTE